MTRVGHDLWSLTFGQPWIDPAELAAAVEWQVQQPDLDFRTQLLIRDSLDALAEHWGPERVEGWLERSRSGNALRQIWRSELGEPGFPTLRRRLMNKTDPKAVLELLGELGTEVKQPVQVVIGGSIALILAGELHRGTDDIDFVDEVPREIRARHDLLDTLAIRYGLRVTHFQSHYLPTGWAGRVRSLGRFGRLDVRLVDPYDAFVGKLFSARRKDRDDLRMLSRNLDKGDVEARLRLAGGTLLADSVLVENASKNWTVLYNEPLPR